MMWELRLLALLGALAFAGLVILPAHAFVPLVGAGCVLIGVLLLGSSALGGAALIGLGVLLIAYGVKLNIRRRREAADESVKTAQDVSRRFAPGFRHHEEDLR
ncbi:MAG: hypothetical protein ACYSUQ_03740 [Planctomycetota bacterium]|jgi:membrane protein implicated in regulation of membrane protease activity